MTGALRAPAKAERIRRRRRLHARGAPSPRRRLAADRHRARRQVGAVPCRRQPQGGRPTSRLGSRGDGGLARLVEDQKGPDGTARRCSMGAGQLPRSSEIAVGLGAYELYAPSDATGALGVLRLDGRPARPRYSASRFSSASSKVNHSGVGRSGRAPRRYSPRKCSGSSPPEATQGGLVNPKRGYCIRLPQRTLSAAEPQALL